MTDESTTPLRVGDMLYGFCGGAFGRDSYADKQVAAIGADWVVAREDNGVQGVPVLYRGYPHTLQQYRTPPCPECELPAVPRGTVCPSCKTVVPGV